MNRFLSSPALDGTVTPLTRRGTVARPCSPQPKDGNPVLEAVRSLEKSPLTAQTAKLVSPLAGAAGWQYASPGFYLPIFGFVLARVIPDEMFLQHCSNTCFAVLTPGVLTPLFCSNTTPLNCCERSNVRPKALCAPSVSPEPNTATSTAGRRNRSAPTSPEVAFTYIIR